MTLNPSSNSILLPQSPIVLLEEFQHLPLHVIDWEFAQFGHRSIDLGQLIGDLCERKHFNNAEKAMWILQGFAEGYGAISDEMLFRTAMHAGVHLICWCTRGPPGFYLKHDANRVREALACGVGFIVKGWERDRKWFERSLLASLFSKK